MRISQATRPPSRFDAFVGSLPRDPYALPLILLAHVALWTIYSCMAQSAGAVHHDMTEAFVWGENPALGYYKHPPLYAWITGLWFEVFPRRDWAFYLLSQVNAATGLAGIWYLAGRLVGPDTRLAALLLLTLAPFHNVMAINFNANTVLLSLWPWTAFAFVKAMQTGRARDGVAFGAIAAAAMLCKYYSGLLLATCVLASLAHPRVQEIYRSRAPYCAVVTAAVLLAPHVGWLAAHDWQTIAYAGHNAGSRLSLVLYKITTTAIASLALSGLPFLALTAAYGREVGHLHRAALRNGVSREGAWLLILATGPYVFTLLAALVAALKISTNFLIPAFSMLPLAVVALSRTTIAKDRLIVIARAAAVWPVTALALSPIISYGQFRLGVDLAAEPRRELAEQVTVLWRQSFQAPLKLVMGTNAYGSGMAFYSSDRPREFIRLSYVYAPWVTPELLRHWGVAIACEDLDSDCAAKAMAIMTAQSRRLSLTPAHTFLGQPSVRRRFDVFLIPPGDIPPVQPRSLHRLE